jgi:pimeloyl-[acyl-carrier protein] synthase
LAHPACQLEFGGVSFFADPYSTYAVFRARGIPAFDRISRAWMITRYADVEALLRDVHVSKNFQRAEPTPFESSILFQDPPDHGRVRGVLNRAFSPDSMARIEGRVRQIADGLIDRMAASSNGIDFITEFAQPLPVAVMAALLGIPPEDSGELHRHCGAFIVEETVPAEESQRRQYLAICAMTEYFEELIARRQARGYSGPNTYRDVPSTLIQAHEKRQLSRGELIGNCILLMIAGHETTVNLLGNGLHLLLRHPDQLELLKRQASLWPSAIEEILRYEAPVQLGTYRITTAPLEIAGRTLDAGSLVTAVIGAANRDPAQFPEPDRFDITRTPNRHLAFGMGPHRCLGSWLARVAARIGFSRLIERLPDLRLAAGPARWRSNAITRGLTELVVSW